MPTPFAANDTNYKQALTPALRELVEACFTLQTTSTKVLAAYLQRSPAAIRTDFQRIRIILGMHSKHTVNPAAAKFATAAFKKDSK